MPICSTSMHINNQRRNMKLNSQKYIRTGQNNNHTQLLESAKSWNLNEDSPAVSLSSLISDNRSLMTPALSSESCSNGRGCIWFSFGWRDNWTSGGRGNGIVGGEAALLVKLALEETIVLSQRKTWMDTGILAWRCSESFWLSETVS